MYRFAPATANESTVFGAAKPKYSKISVNQWLEFMQVQKINRVCCLLEQKTINRYESDLLTAYQQTFGQERVLWRAIADFQIPNPAILIESIIPFLISAEQDRQKVVVHCSGGIGRTGIVLAVWLVSRRGLSNKQALCAVRQQKRLPQEAIIAALLFNKNPLHVKRQLNNLLNTCRTAFS